MKPTAEHFHKFVRLSSNTTGMVQSVTLKICHQHECFFRATVKLTEVENFYGVIIILLYSSVPMLAVKYNSDSKCFRKLNS